MKVLLHSMYGTTIFKPVETETVVVPHNMYEKYISYNYNDIKSCVRGGDRCYVKTIKHIVNHYNYVHGGVEIISLSTRTMNKVMVLVNDLGLMIYYRDPDSMHIHVEGVDTLVEPFKAKYSRDLIGEDMSQFHIDFGMDGACGETYVVESYFIAKDVYIDKLENVGKDEHAITSYHVRMKSVPISCIDHTSNATGSDPLELYT